MLGRTAHRKLPWIWWSVLLASAALPAAGVPQTPQAEGPLPTAQEIFERYAQAIGGRAAWEKITSRVSRGTIQVEGLDGTGTMLVYERAPNLQLSVLTLPNGAVVRDGFDGQASWEQDPSGKVTEVTGARGADNRAEADFYSEIELGKLFPHARTAGRQTVDGRQAYVVEGSIPGGTMRKLYFEVDTGLRFRTEIYENALSPSPTTVFRYDDYREIDGIKFPFKGSIEGPGPVIRFRFTVLRHNVPVTDDQIARPASATPAPR
jgi:hypothetical protein